MTVSYPVKISCLASGIFSCQIHSPWFGLVYDVGKIKCKILSAGTFSIGSTIEITVAAIDANNSMYCLQKRIEKFALGIQIRINMLVEAIVSFDF